MYPEDLKYTEQHEWARLDEPGGRIRVGITSFAQEALGDIVFVSVPAEGSPVQAGETFGEVESTKSVSDLYAPVSGTVVATNPELETQPELINSDPYGSGWIVEIEVAEADQLGTLLDAAGYEKLVAES